MRTIRRARGLCPSGATVSCRCPRLRHGLGRGGAHALGGLVRDDHVVHGLRTLPILDQREFDFELALAVPLVSLIVSFMAAPYFFLPALFLMFSGRSAWGFQPLAASWTRGSPRNRRLIREWRL